MGSYANSCCGTLSVKALKMNEAYRVDYQISQLVYFESDGVLPKGRDYSELWQDLVPLRKEKMSGCFWQLGQKKLPKPRRLKIGDAASVAELLNDPDSIYLGGGAECKKAVSRGCDYDFYLALSSSSRCDFGPTPPYFLLTLSNVWMMDLLGLSSTLNILRRSFEVLDRSSPFYGFVDLDRAEDIYNGYMYGSGSIMNAPLSRFVDQALWLRSVNLKRHQARSIYWGNYFGNIILDKVGGRESFLSYCREKTTSRYGTPTILIWEFTNGVFVSLSDSFSDCTPGGIVSTLIPRNIKWLYDRLAEGNAIIGA